MGIVKMKKFTLLAFDSQKDSLLKEFQRFEEVHFKTLSPDGDDFFKRGLSRSDVTAAEDELFKVRFALDKLSPYARQPSGLKAYTAAPTVLDYADFDSYTSSYDYTAVYEAVRAEDDHMNGVRAETVRMKAENDSLKPWAGLDIAPSELDGMKTVRYITGTIAKTVAETLRRNLSDSFSEVYVETVGAVKDGELLLILLPADEYDAVSELLKNNGFSRLSPGFTGLPADIIKTNNERARALSRELAASIDRLRALADEYEKLLIASDYFETALERHKAAENFLGMETVVLIEGWFPAVETDAFMAIVEKTCTDGCYLETEDVEKDSDDVPIKLKNNRFVSAFEGITAMYSLPKYNEVDPTPIFAPFYWLFFGLMMGDVGYGVVFLVGSWLMLKYMHFKPGMTKMVSMFCNASSGIILGGILYGSVFGFTLITPLPAPGGGFKAILDSNTDIVYMLIVAIALGIVHIVIGLMTKGYVSLKNGHIVDAICDSLIYILILISGVLMLVSATGMLSKTIADIAFWSFWIFLALIALTQGRSSKSIGGKFGNGLYAAYGLTSYVGDIVSYTRITALALSGAYIGYSFNLMSSLIPGWLFFIFGIAIMLVGHLLNFALSALGAYVHTSRLQYVEFFGKFYEGGGIPFTPLKLKNNNIKLNK